MRIYYFTFRYAQLEFKRQIEIKLINKYKVIRLKQQIFGTIFRNHINYEIALIKSHITLIIKLI